MALRAAEADEAAKVGRAPRPAAGPLAGLPDASSTERCVFAVTCMRVAGAVGLAADCGVWRPRADLEICPTARHTLASRALGVHRAAAPERCR